MTENGGQCHWCGAYHGPRCPSVAAMEFHPDGSVKRVEFAQYQMVKIDPAAIEIGPTGLVPDGKGGFRLGSGADALNWGSPTGATP